MVRTKATARRLNRPTFVAAPGQRIGNKKYYEQKEIKIKTISPKALQVELKKKMAKF